MVGDVSKLDVLGRISGTFVKTLEGFGENGGGLVNAGILFVTIGNAFVEAIAFVGAIKIFVEISGD